MVKRHSIVNASPSATPQRPIAELGPRPGLWEVHAGLDTLWSEDMALVFKSSFLAHPGWGGGKQKWIHFTADVTNTFPAAWFSCCVCVSAGVSKQVGPESHLPWLDGQSSGSPAGWALNRGALVMGRWRSWPAARKPLSCAAPLLLPSTFPPPFSCGHFDQASALASLTAAPFAWPPCILNSPTYVKVYGD